MNRGKKKSYAVIGLGRFGRAVAQQLYAMGHEVLAVDKDDRLVQIIADRVTQAVAADAQDEMVLKNLGIRNYDHVVVAIGDNITDSVLITLLLKELGVKRVLCKAQDMNHKKILMKIGAENVVIPEYEMGLKVAAQISASNVIDFMALAEDYGIADVHVPKKWIGKSMKTLDIRRKYGINVVAVKDSRDYDKIAIFPDADYVFAETDIIVMIGRDEQMNAIGEI